VVIIGERALSATIIIAFARVSFLSARAMPASKAKLRIIYFRENPGWLQLKAKGERPLITTTQPHNLIRRRNGRLDIFHK
jgi:hypothetical protein